MPSLKDRLLNYLEILLGERPDLTVKANSALPLFLRQRYAFCSTRLFGRKTLLAIEAEDWTGESPGEYGKRAEILRMKLGERYPGIVGTALFRQKPDGPNGHPFHCSR